MISAPDYAIRSSKRVAIHVDPVVRIIESKASSGARSQFVG
jgi:hypothetical protein